MDFVTALPAVAWFILLILMYALECLVAFLQAYVFTILSASYIGMATHPPLMRRGGRNAPPFISVLQLVRNLS